MGAGAGYMGAGAGRIGAEAGHIRAGVGPTAGEDGQRALAAVEQGAPAMLAVAAQVGARGT